MEPDGWGGWEVGSICPAADHLRAWPSGSAMQNSNTDSSPALQTDFLTPRSGVRAPLYKG